MKFVVLLVLCALFLTEISAAAAGRKDASVRNKRSSSKLRWSSIYVTRSICEMSCDVPTALVKVARQRNFSLNDYYVQDYAYCVYADLNLLKDDGTLDENGGYLVPKVNAKKYAEAVRACVDDVYGFNVADLLWNQLSCFYQHYPNAPSML